MNNQWTIGKKLIASFIGLSLITLILGSVGYYGASRSNNDITEIGIVRLPSVQSLMEINEAKTAVDSAENALLSREIDLAARLEKYKAIEDAFKRAEEAWKIYEPLPQSPEEAETWKKFVPAWEAWKKDDQTYVAQCKEYDRMVEAAKQDGKAVNDRIDAQYKKLTTQALVTNAVTFNAADELVRKLVDINVTISRDAVKSGLGASAFTKILSLFAMIACVICSLLLGVLISRNINSRLKAVIDGLSSGADQVSSASSQVSSASQSLAEGASEQAASIEETSSSLEELTSMTRQNSDNARQANSLMSESMDVVKDANASMDRLIESMEEISKASAETSKIIKTIDEISFQTNLLALNAAVEAARAGEAGAGFAVVADEVRNLAMRAAEAAKNTSSLIEETVKRIKDGSNLVEKTNDAFKQVAAGSAKVGGLIGEIAAASQEQADGIGQISKAITEMDSVTQRNAANAEESASASEEMSAQAEQMKDMVDQLVVMVDGGASAFSGSAPSIRAHSIPVKARKPVNKRAVSVKNHPAPKALPMDDEFQDF
jgi:methyl-accepting chemotaxis protein